MRFMSKIFILLTAIVTFVASPVWAADFSRLVILHTNDTHGYDYQDKEHNGMAAIAQLKLDYEALGRDVLLLDAGDAIQDNNLVNFSKGKSAIQFMNAAGYDAATLGNHEFDYGQDVLQERIYEALFPYISANIIVDATGKSFIKPYTIIQKGDIKIGIVGMTTPYSITSTSPKNVKGLTFLQGKALWAEIQKNVDKLRAQGCDLIIALGHMGSTQDYNPNTSEAILQNVRGIDIFIDGHDHLVKNQYINNALLTETGCYTKNIGRIVYKDNKWQGDMLSYTPQNSRVKLLVETTASAVSASLDEILGSSEVMLDGTRAPGVRTKETNGGDFCADALLWQARQANVLSGDVDAAIYNGGGIRSSIPAGQITRSMLYSVAPYNNQLYVIKIMGTKLLEIIEAATASTPEAAGSFPQVAGIRYTLNTQVPYNKGEKYSQSHYYAPATPGSRVTIEEVNGKPFQPDKLYTIALAEFLALGGDSYAGLCQPNAVLASQSIGYLDVQALENYLTEELHGSIGSEYAAAQGRITIK